MTSISAGTTATAEPTPGLLRLGIANEWPSVMLVGLITAALGVIIVVWPSETLTVVSVLLGIQLLIFGLYRLIAAFSSSNQSPVLLGLFGVIGMMAGVIVLRNPFETIAVLATILGVVWIVGGAIDVVASIDDDTLESRGLLALGGLLSVAAGVIVVSWPEPTITVVAWISGIYLIAIGLLFCFEAFSLRRLAN